MVHGFVQEALSRGSQTTNTSFMTQSLRGGFCFSSTSLAVEAVLSGMYDLPRGTDYYVLNLLPHLQMPAALAATEKLESIIPKEGFARSWSRMREFTGTGHSGIHFGHFKVMHISSLSTDIYSGLAEIPYKSGFSPNRWKRCVDHMLQKSQDNFHSDRFRPINFLEADAHYNLKHMAREAMAYGESKGIIAKEQYGSRKYHSSETQALNKRLTFDSWRLRKTPGVLCVNAAICLRRFGLEKGPIASMIETLQCMTHLIHTAWGTCEGYGPDIWHLTLQGILQGNGAGPCIWLVISVTLFSMLREEGFGMKFITPLSQQKSHIVGIAIVDDADIVESEITNTATGEETLIKAQEALDHWEGGLRATGGAIVPAKSHWYYVAFR